MTTSTRAPRRRPGYANLTSTLALVVALGGTGAYAATKITGHDIKDGSITSADVRDKSLRKADFKPGQLPQGARGPAGPTGLTGLERVVAVSSEDSTSYRFATATCPVGKVVVGGTGGIVQSTLGDPVALVGSYFNPASGLATSVQALGAEISPTANTWAVRAEAVCANPTP
ncbi:hypothetical protein BH11ACT8_BH11ACT8_09910 [soil metagenome]